MIGGVLTTGLDRGQSPVAENHPLAGASRLGEMRSLGPNRASALLRPFRARGALLVLCEWRLFRSRDLERIGIETPVLDVMRRAEQVLRGCERFIGALPFDREGGLERSVIVTCVIRNVLEEANVIGWHDNPPLDCLDRLLVRSHAGLARSDHNLRPQGRGDLDGQVPS